MDSNEQKGTFASLMEQYLSDPAHDYKTLKYGDVIEGSLMRIDRDELLVDIGSKAEGIVPVREFSSLSSEEKHALNVGDTILVFVVQAENQEGHPVVSIDRARQEKSWRQLQEVFEANDVIEAEVTNYNKGGLLVNLDGVRGFVPASQVSEIRGGDDAAKQADMARLIGTSLPLKVIEINRHRNRLILSERQAVQERRDVMKEKLIEELREGEVRRGRVSSICDFGAFVDIGGADGLVHLSELSWSRVRHPSEILKIGQETDVYVLGINPQEKKIALSIKRTQAEPWSQVAAKYEVGQLVRGSVTQLANFGAFARIEDGIEGLIHVSELTDERISHPKQVVQEGQDLLLRIIRIDPERRRMGLSLRRALETPDEELAAILGEDAPAEKVRIIEELNAALIREGIEPGSGRRDDDDEDGEGEDGYEATEKVAVVAEIPAVDATSIGLSSMEAAFARAGTEEKPKKVRAKKSDEGELTGVEALAALAEELEASEKAEEKPAKKTTKKAAAEAEAVAAEGEAVEAAEKPAKKTTKKAAAEAEADGGEAAAKPAKKTTKKSAAAEPEAVAAEAAAITIAPEVEERLVAASPEGEGWTRGTGTVDCPAGFPVKGNADSGIYHTEESMNYGATIAEVCFATAEAAEAAGFRAPGN